MRCVLKYNKYKYGQEVTRELLDVVSINMATNSNEMMISTEVDNVRSNHRFEVNDSFKLEVTPD